MQLGPVGIWGRGVWLREERRDEVRRAAGELERLGYTSLWLTAGFGEGVPSVFHDVLASTSTMTVASGILSIWHSTPAQTATATAQLERDHPGRFLLGLGTSHAPRVERNGQEYSRPFSRMVAYLDELDRAEPPVGRERRVLAALGPRMLRLSADRSAGAHPYFVPVEHTAHARKVLGEGPLLVPEQAVVLERDPGRARALARRHMARYLCLPNYADNLRRLGWGESDLAAEGSDRLVDAIVAWGGPDAARERVQAHLAAGADSVCVQVITGDAEEIPLAAYRTLADVLL